MIIRMSQDDCVLWSHAKLYGKARILHCHLSHGENLRNKTISGSQMQALYISEAKIGLKSYHVAKLRLSLPSGEALEC